MSGKREHIISEGNDCIPFLHLPGSVAGDPHLGLISRPAAQPPAGSGGVYPAFPSPAFPTASSPSQEPSWVWPLTGQGEFSILSARTTWPRRKACEHVCFHRGPLEGACLIWENPEPSLRRLLHVMRRPSALLWVLSRLAWERQAGEARRWPCGRIVQWWCFHSRKQASQESQKPGETSFVPRNYHLWLKMHEVM